MAADLPVQPLSNYGALLGSYGDSLATQTNAVTNNFTAHANATQIPSQIAQTQAQTQNVQAQTTGADLANQQKALQLQYYSHLLDSMNSPYVNDQGTNPQSSSGLSVGMQSAQGSPADAGTSTATHSTRQLANSEGAAAGEGDLTIDDAGLDPAHITRGAQEQFGVQNVWTPQEFNQLKLAMASGVPGAADIVKQTHDARIQNATVTAQRAASKAYDNAVAIATAPEGRAFDVLKQISPHEGIAPAIDQIAKQKSWTDEQKDEFARSFAVEVGNASHRYSGRDVSVGKDGVARDAVTNQPLLGGAPEGMDAKSYQEAYKSATELVSVKNSDGSESQIPRWKQAGANSATQFVNAQAGVNTLPQRGLPRQLVPPPTTAPVQGGAPGQQQPQPSAPADPVLRQALADPDYKLQTPPVVAGRTPTPAQLDQQKATVAARNDLVNESQGAISTASQSLMYLDAAKAILNSPSSLPKSGPIATVIANAARIGGWDPATDRQEIAKYLGNAALQNGKSNFGKNFTQKENDIQMNQLSPNVHMTDTALNNLIDSSRNNMQYTLDSAKRARQFVMAGGDAQQFQDWNAKYWDRSKTVNQASGGQTKAAQAPTTTGGLPRITSPQQLSTLQKGTRFVGPDGQIRVKN